MNNERTKACDWCLQQEEKYKNYSIWDDYWKMSGNRWTFDVAMPYVHFLQECRDNLKSATHFAQSLEMPHALSTLSSGQTT